MKQKTPFLFYNLIDDIKLKQVKDIANSNTLISF